MGTVDIDAAAARLDLEAVIGRVDLAGLARQVLEEIDLPEIIRESTGSMASDTLRGVRMQTISADDAVGRAVDKLAVAAHATERRGHDSRARTAPRSVLMNGAISVAFPARRGPTRGGRQGW